MIEALTPKQSYVMDLLEDNRTTEIVAGGAAGGGKSFIIGWWAGKMAIRHPGSRWFIGRRELKRLKETTLVTFLDVMREQGVQHGKHYTIDFQNSVIKFVNGSKILLLDLAHMPSDPQYERLGSMEFTGGAIDEASEVDERAKNVLTTRLRYRTREFGVKAKLLMTCNPHKGWLYHTFFKPWRAGTLPSYRAFVPALATDNPHLTPEYLEILSRLTGADRERLLLGNWDYDNDPTRLMETNRINDLWTNEFVGDGERFITADIAMMGSDRFVIVVWSGYRVILIKATDKISASDIEYEIKETAQTYNVPRSNIAYDSDGLGEYLNSYLAGAVAFHNGATPLERAQGPYDVKENFPNLKTQCYYEFARMVKRAEIFILEDDYKTEITEELFWVKRDKVDVDGKLFLLPKKEVKKGLGHSPDFSDALMMRMYFKISRERSTETVGAASDDNLLGQAAQYGGPSLDLDLY